MPSAFNFPDLPGYVNDTGNTADHNTQMNATTNGAVSTSADPSCQASLWTSWAIIVGALALLWVLGYAFKG